MTPIARYTPRLRACREMGQSRTVPGGTTAQKRPQHGQAEGTQAGRPAQGTSAGVGLKVEWPRGAARRGRPRGGWGGPPRLPHAEKGGKGRPLRQADGGKQDGPGRGVPAVDGCELEH